jgi:hypothetical protein
MNHFHIKFDNRPFKGNANGGTHGAVKLENNR